MTVLVFAVMVVQIVVKDVEAIVLAVVMAIVIVDVKVLVLSLVAIKDALECVRKDAKVIVAANALTSVGVAEVIVALELALLQIQVILVLILNEDNK